MKKPSGFEPPSMYDKLPEMPIENPLENFPKAPEKDLSPIEQFQSPIRHVKNNPSQHARVPSNYKTLDDTNPLEYTIDKNPEYNMHHPKFAETFK